MGICIIGNVVGNNNINETSEAFKEQNKGYHYGNIDEANDKQKLTTQHPQKIPLEKKKLNFLVTLKKGLHI
jgi:hypothetical protein